MVECGETGGQRSRVQGFQFPDGEKLIVRWAGFEPCPGSLVLGYKPAGTDMLLSA